MASEGEDVYATLLLSDSYLPGALVLAHSLRDAGTTKKLAVLITADTVSTAAITQLQGIYDFIIPVERIVNEEPANLFLMNRGDLHSTFTKINLWKQTQFRQIVYMDADTVAIRAPDELFDLPHAFSAAPDIGWPDIFNTGLMVLTPNMGDYYALIDMAQRGISFDGADQGLLNMHFQNTFNRLSFTYNVTPSAHYQYLPAYRHFQSNISMVHFIGHNKPWTEGRDVHTGGTPYDESVGRWWAVYDRHFKEPSIDSSAKGTSTIVQYHTKGEFHPAVPAVPSSSYPAYQPSEPKSDTHQAAGEIRGDVRPAAGIQSVVFDTAPGSDVGISHAVEQPLLQRTDVPKYVGADHVPPAPEVKPEIQPDIKPEIQYTTWDASRAPPPPHSRPEASNFPDTHYQMSSDPEPFKAPERYPDPPKDMWYQVPKTPTYQKPTPIFPWEKDAARPTRVFPEDEPDVTGGSNPDIATESGPLESDPEPIYQPVTSTTQAIPSDPWQSYYSRGNAWDDIPEIGRYVGSLQKPRKGSIQVLHSQGSPTGEESNLGARRRGLKLTDFPTELERPSLPVTPAPIRRPSFWGEERNEEGELPAAEGVPSQEEWDPAVQLEQLARRQSDVLAREFGEEPGREIPIRPLPYGSEGIISPSYAMQVASIDGGPATSEPSPGSVILEPSYGDPLPAFEKNETFPTRATPEPATEEELDVLQT